VENIVKKALSMGFDCQNAELIREKDGVTVARLFAEDATAILKWFSAKTSLREIENYRILDALDIPTLNVMATAADAIIMEDMASPACPFRLANEADMADAALARSLAAWYRRLHEAGFAHVKAHGGNMYSEAALFTRENIENIRMKSGLRDLAVWRLLDEGFDIIARIVADTPMTLTYNDFYYTNMAVARDGGAAIMFDYNMLGKGHVYSDIRNVEYSLSPEAAAAFREAYGECDFSREAAIDAVVSPIVTLHLAYSRSAFPDWAWQELQNLKTDYIRSVEKLISL